jgi:hypothetical protein
MDAESIVRGAEALLEQIVEEPDEVLVALDQAGRDRVLEQRGALADQAARVRDDADLLELADAIHRLAEETPALRSLLLEEAGLDLGAERAQREVTLADHRATGRQSVYSQQRAAQLQNSVIQCRAQLLARLEQPRRPKPGR